MKKILITGAGGFIGSHLAERCVTLGYQVKAFTHYNSKNHWGWLESSPLRNDMEIVTGDIRDFDSVQSAVKDCDSIFHLAALIGIPYSYVSPLAYIRTNVEGTYNILQAARQANVEKVLVTSTSETYGSAQYVPMDEKHPAVGQSPYSATKIAADNIALSYYLSFNLPVTIVRPFNTYGPRQSARAIIPTIISQLLEGKSVRLGNLTPTRDLTFVEDTVEGFLSIAKASGVQGQSINIGMGTEVSVGDLAKMISKIIGVPLNIEHDEVRIRPQNSEVERLFCDNSKALSLTSWKPASNLESGLRKTVDWFKDNRQYYESKTKIYHV